MAHEFCWMELTTDNLKAARGFYADLFGWSYNDHEMDQGGTYAMFQPGAGGPGGGMMAKPLPEVPTAWTPYVAVSDLDASVERVRELGGTVMMGPAPIPGFGAFAIVADPTGGVLGLWRSDEASS